MSFLSRWFGSPPSDPCTDESISCLVRGLIHSMQENPDIWVDVGTIFEWYTPHKDNPADERILINPYGEFNSNGLAPPISWRERRALADALQRYVIDPRKSADHSRQNKVIGYFESLGCLPRQ